MPFDIEHTFNPEEYLYFYRDVLTPEKLQQEIDFLVKYTHLDHSKHILDLACGHGRHANVLSQMGHQVVGVDVSPGFLEIAKRDAENKNLNVEFRRQDMRDLHDREVFDRVISMFTALGYFDDDQNEVVFKNIYNALKSGGIFCFDSHNRDTFLTYFQPVSMVEREGNYLIDQRTYDTLSGFSKTKRTVIYKGATKNFNFDVRLYNPTELTTLFKKIGFSTVDFYGNWEGKSISAETKRMIVVAKK